MSNKNSFKECLELPELEVLLITHRIDLKCRSDAPLRKKEEITFSTDSFGAMLLYFLVKEQRSDPVCSKMMPKMAIRSVASTPFQPFYSVGNG